MFGWVADRPLLYPATGGATGPRCVLRYAGVGLGGERLQEVAVPLL